MNGSWNDGGRIGRSASANGFADELILKEEDIPAVGSKPDPGYKEGSWDVTPVGGTLITENTTYTYTYAKGDTPAPSPAPADTTPVGSVHNVDGSSYVVTSADAVSLVKAAGKKSFTLPAAVNINGKTFNVTGINAKAFKGTKAKTLTVKTKMLTKKSVKGSLKGSKVKKVKVKVGKKKENKKYVKKYKKIFAKKNAGKKVKVTR